MLYRVALSVCIILYYRHGNILLFQGTIMLMVWIRVYHRTLEGCAKGMPFLYMEPPFYVLSVGCKIVFAPLQTINISSPTRDYHDGRCEVQVEESLGVGHKWVILISLWVHTEAEGAPSNRIHDVGAKNPVRRRKKYSTKHKDLRY